MSELSELEAKVGEAAERQGPAVVGVGRGWGLGSGFVFAPGYVLTRLHSLRHHEAAISFADGRSEPGKLVAGDEDLDLAVLAVDTADVEPLAWAEDDGPPAIGRSVIAMANPGGRGLRVTPGFVSSAGRSFRGPRGRRLRGVIEHTAPLPRGSAGGPLLGADGRVLGINAVRVDGGLILAAPADAELRARVEALRSGQARSTPRLGVAVAPPRVARRLRHAVGLPERDGILVRAVEDDSPAAQAGLARGDLIVGAGGQPLERLDALYDALESASGEGDLELEIVRGTEERSVTVSFS